MGSGSACPTAKELQQLVQGRFGLQDAEHLAQHLEQCHGCAQTVEDLLAHDTILEAMRSKAPALPSGEVVEGLIAKLSGLRPPDAASATEIPEGLARPDIPPLSSGTQEIYDFLNPPQQADELGRLGPYRILKVLGTGGMGVVFEAEDLQLRRTVALKAIRPSLAASSAARERFLREARAAAAVKHDHIVTIYQVGEDRGVPFLAMELLQGETLATRVQREGRLPIPEVLRIGREVAEGLAAAHAHRLIHRDIKPANIWLEDRGHKRLARELAQPELTSEPLVATASRVKILDFGLARMAGEDAQLTGPGFILGTPAYMAPEQARASADVDARCDLFSLGCMLYHLCTGRVPFQGAEALAILHAVANEKPVPPGELNPEIPAPLADLILRLLAKDPADRPPSARAVAEALAILERQQTVGRISNPSYSNPNRSDGTGTAQPEQTRPARTARRRWVAAAAALLALAAGGVLAAQIILRITDKEGNTRDIPVKPGDKVEIVQQPAGPHKKTDPPNKPGTPLPDKDKAHRLQPLTEVRRLEGHTGQVNGVAFSGDGKKALTCGMDKTVRLWDVDTGKELRQFAGHEGPVWCIALSSDGCHAVSACDGDIRLWDVTTGLEIERLRGHTGRVMSLAFSADGLEVFSGGFDQTVRRWDVKTRKQKGPSKGKDTAVMCLALSSDSHQVLVGGNDGIVRLWDVAKDQLRRLEGHWEMIDGVAFSSDGGQAVSTSADTTVRLWDVKTGRQLRSIAGHQTGVTKVVFCPEGRRILTGSGTRLASGGGIRPAGWDYRVRLWDAANGQELARFEGHTSCVTDLAVSADGRFALSGSSDGTVRVLRLPEADNLPRVSLPADGARPARLTWPADLLRQGKVPAPVLSGVKPLHDDEFQDPRSGFESKDDWGETRYVRGQLYLLGTPPVGAATTCPWGRFTHFACEVTGRLAGPAGGSWGLTLEGGRRQGGKPGEPNRVFITLNRAGQLEVKPGPGQPGGVARFEHPAIKGQEAWNTLLIVVRGRQIELYVNSVAVCDPLVMDYDFTPGWLRLEVEPAPKAALDQRVRLADLERIRLWPAEAISRPEERGASARD